MPPPYLWIFLLFSSVAINAVLLLGLAAALLAAQWNRTDIVRAVRLAGGLLFGWLGVVGALGWGGLFVTAPDRPFPWLAVALTVPVFLGGLLLRRSPALAGILAAVPQGWLVGLQAYRGLGAIFLVLHGIGLLPGVFALPAGIGDVAVGLGALGVAGAWAARTKRRGTLTAVWNILGLADLAVAVGVGFLSAPTRLQLLALDAPNVLIGHYPLVLVPAYIVPLSVVLHLASLTKLARERAPHQV